MLHGHVYVFVFGVYKGEVIEADDRVQFLHVGDCNTFKDKASGKEDLAVGMVYDMLYVAWLELVKDRYWNRSVGQAGEEDHGPVSLVLGTDGNLVSFLNTYALEYDVHLGYPSCNIAIIKRNSLIIRESRSIPIVFEALLDYLVQRVGNVHHNIIGLD